jgi:hypothetical protein
MKKCQILGQTFEIGGFISHNAEKVVKTTSPDKNIPSHEGRTRPILPKMGFSLGQKYNLSNTSVISTPLSTSDVNVIETHFLQLNSFIKSEMVVNLKT